MVPYLPDYRVAGLSKWMRPPHCRITSTFPQRQDHLIPCGAATQFGRQADRVTRMFIPILDHKPPNNTDLGKDRETGSDRVRRTKQAFRRRRVEIVQGNLPRHTWGHQLPLGHEIERSCNNRTRDRTPTRWEEREDCIDTDSVTVITNFIVCEQLKGTWKTP